MFTLMLTAGLRQRELHAVKWSDLDEDSGVLTVSEGRAVVKGKLMNYDGGTRRITLSAETAAAPAGAQPASQQRADVHVPRHMEAICAYHGAPAAPTDH